MPYRTTLLWVMAYLLHPAFGQQAPAIEWQRTLGGSDYDLLYDMVPANGGGVFVTGSTNSMDGDVTINQGAKDCWVVKLDDAGALLWQKTVGGTSNDYARAVLPTDAGGCIVAGNTRSADGDVTGHHGDQDFWVVELDGAGTLMWQKALGGSDEEGAHALAHTTDGGFVVAGYTRSTDGDVTNVLGDYDYWVVKLDATGGLVWQKSLGGSGADVATSIVSTTDGGYLVAGYSGSTDGDVTNPHGSDDIWVVKLDGAGDLVWQKTIGGSDFDIAEAVALTPDGGSIVVGATGSVDGDVTDPLGGLDQWIVKLDDMGGLEWQRTLGGSDYDVAHSIAVTADGGYLTAGVSASTDGDVTDPLGSHDYWVVRMDGSGALLWQKSLGGSGAEFGPVVLPTIPGSCIVAGFTESTDGDVTNHHGVQDFWLVRLGPEDLGSVIEEQGLVAFQCTPNPAVDAVRLRTSHVPHQARLTLANTIGQAVWSAPLISTDQILDLASVPPGMYFLTLRTNQGLRTERLVLE